MLLHYMSEWVQNYAPPATIIIISGDKYFYHWLLHWQRIGYTIMGAAHNAHEIAWMRQVATPWWDWDLLATGHYSTRQQHMRWDPPPRQPIQVLLPTLVAEKYWNVALLA